MSFTTVYVAPAAHKPVPVARDGGVMRARAEPPAMALETMEPNPAWDAEAYAEAVETIADVQDEVTFLIWGGDWCPDCRRQLPDFAAALAAAGVSDERIYEYPVEKRADGSKVGPKVNEYGIERIPTVVVQYHGREIARFTEDAPVPIVVHLADRLADADIRHDHPT